MVSVCVRINEFEFESYHYPRKMSTIKNLNKPKFRKFSGKSKVSVSSKYSRLNTRISRLTGYICQSSSCLGILKVVAWGNVPIF